MKYVGQIVPLIKTYDQETYEIRLVGELIKTKV
jgi:hypothetical protein